jgi:hypothetical protein
VGASTSHRPIGLHGLLQGQLYFFIRPIAFLTTTVISFWDPGKGDNEQGGGRKWVAAEKKKRKKR